MKITHKRKFLRGLTYASLISICNLFSLYLKDSNEDIFFLLTVSIGVIILLVENIFILHYLIQNSSIDTKVSLKWKLLHNLNHIIYPVLTYAALSIYIYIETNFNLVFFLIISGAILFTAYYYFLFDHLTFGHVEQKESRHSDHKADFVAILFKIFSYFTLTVVLYQSLVTYRIDSNTYFILSILFTFLFLFLHLNRIRLINIPNLLTALIFSFVSSLFTVQILNDEVGALQPFVATIIFYLTSGIFYHKLDGTLYPKIVLEYALIATIVSVFIFST